MSEILKKILLIYTATATKGKTIPGTSPIVIQLHAHIKPILCNLHWLPIEQGITFKVLLFVFKCLNNFPPIYLFHLIKLHQPQRQLRSSTEMIEYDTPSNK